MDADRSLHVEKVLDLGQQGCGQLVMEIMFAMRTLDSGQILQVIAYDPAAAVDIAAWCRMTGNILRLPSSEESHTQHMYFIQKG